MESLVLTRNQVVLLAVVVEAGLAAIALVAGWLLGLPVRDWLAWSVEGLLWGAVGAAVLVGLLEVCRRVPVGPIARLMHLIDEHVKPLFRQCTVFDLLVISILAGLGEELFFRGFLHDWLVPSFLHWFGPAAGPWITVALVSLLFGLAHCLSREYVLFATLFGALLGVLALSTGGLLAPILAHAGYDFVALLVLTRSSRPSAPSPGTG